MPTKLDAQKVRSDFVEMCKDRGLDFEFLSAKNIRSFDSKGQAFNTWVISYKCDVGHSSDANRSHTKKPSFGCNMCAGYGLSIEERVEKLQRIHKKKYSYDGFVDFHEELTRDFH